MIPKLFQIRSRGQQRGPAPQKGKLLMSDVQGLWLASLKQPWRSIALVPIHSGGSVFQLATALCELASVFRGRNIQLVQGINVTLETVSHVVDQISAAHDAAPEGPGCQQAIVALECPLDNPIGAPVALSADGVILVAELGVSKVSSARQTIEMLGRDLIRGVVVMR